MPSKVKKKQGKKNKKKGDSEFFANNPGIFDDWKTTSALDMEMDEAPSNKQEPQQPQQRQQQQGSMQGDGDAMDTSEGPETKKKKKNDVPGKVTKIPELCEVRHTMKRGNRTTAQKRRKAEATAKAVARADRLPTKATTKQQKKQTKRALKGIYE